MSFLVSSAVTLLEDVDSTDVCGLAGSEVISLALLSGATGCGAFTGSGPFAELLLVNSLDPWANRHLSPYLHWPFSRQFLHISYFSRRTTGWGAAVAAAAAVPLEPWDEFLSVLDELFGAAALPEVFRRGAALSREELVPPLSDWEEGLPKLCSPSGCLWCCYG